MPEDWKLLVKFGGKRLYAITCQAVADGKMTVAEASRFLNEPPQDIMFCVEEIEAVMKAIRNAMENGLTVDNVMAESTH